MDPKYDEMAARITARINSYLPRQARYRYFETPDGWMFIWTTEKMGDGKYGSAIQQPYGPGSRSGRNAVTRWKPVREVHHTTRKAAKARALRLYHQHKEK